jgi:hypothetical protein
MKAFKKWTCTFHSNIEYWSRSPYALLSMDGVLDEGMSEELPRPGTMVRGLLKAPAKKKHMVSLF